MKTAQEIINEVVKEQEQLKKEVLENHSSIAAANKLNGGKS